MTVKPEKLNVWLTILTNVAVVLGIVFLVIEIAQNTAAIRNQSSIGVNDSLAHLNQAIYTDPELADIWLRGKVSFGNLDPIEKERFSAFLLERMNLAVYVRELERSNAGDVHIDWIAIIKREIVENPGICEFIVSVPTLEPQEFWKPMIDQCIGPN